MSHECDVAEVRAVVNEWRTKAMTVVVLVVALIGLPMFFVAVLRDGLHLSWNLRAAVAAAFLMVVLAGWRHGWSLEVRALMFFTGVYSISAIQLGTTGLVGSGRIGLMLFPLLALVLVGNRGGWLAAGVSLILFAGATGLTAGGVLEQSHLALDYSTNPAFWSLQGTMRDGNTDNELSRQSHGRQPPRGPSGHRRDHRHVPSPVRRGSDANVGAKTSCQ